jgi:hypothetical protein
MTSELGERHIERMKEQIDLFEQGEVSLGQLIAQLESLLGLLLDEADPEWVGDLEAECNRLEYANAAAINDQRALSDDEVEDVSDAIRQMRLMLTRY